MTTPHPTSIRDVKAEHEAEKERLLALARETDAAYSSCFTTPAGEVVLKQLCLQFGVSERCFVPDADKAVDPHRGAIRDGEQAVVFHILKRIAAGKGEKCITIPLKQIP